MFDGGIPNELVSGEAASILALAMHSHGIEVTNLFMWTGLYYAGDPNYPKPFKTQNLLPMGGESFTPFNFQYHIVTNTELEGTSLWDAAASYYNAPNGDVWQSPATGWSNSPYWQTYVNEYSNNGLVRSYWNNIGFGNFEVNPVPLESGSSKIDLWPWGSETVVFPCGVY